MEPKEVLSVKTEPGRDGPPILNLPAYLSIQRPQKMVQMSETKTPKLLSRCWFFNIHRRLSQGRVSPVSTEKHFILALVVADLAEQLVAWALVQLFSHQDFHPFTICHSCTFQIYIEANLDPKREKQTHKCTCALLLRSLAIQNSSNHLIWGSWFLGRRFKAANQ